MFIKTNNEVSYTATDIEAMENIPAGNWLLKFHPMKGYYLEMTPSFKFPKKIYGDAEKLAKRYLNTFNESGGNLGILLTGTKGTGKSVTAKLTANNSGFAVIIITEPFHDEDFKSFLSNITQKCVVFVDEFEKVYHNQELQNSFLSILDGVFEGEKIFLFTSNEKDRVNQYMLNRPGRIHYLGEYDSLSDEIINDVIEDNLIIKEHKEELLSVLNILGTVTMDILISLIKEMNMYEENAKTAISYLNLKPDSSMYEVEIYQGETRLGSTVLRSHPLAEESVSIEFMCDDITKYNYPENEVSNKNIIDDWCESEYKVEESPVPAILPTPIKESGWLYLEVDIEKSKVINKDKKIIIEADNDMRYICTRKKSYHFTF